MPRVPVLRVLGGVWTACLAVTAVLLVVAPAAARFGLVALSLAFSAIGLSMATDLGGAGVASARWIGQVAWTPSASASRRVARLWGGVCCVAGLVMAAQAMLDDRF